MNRDMVRAHNEVMQVIGVAEPDSGPTEAEKEAKRRYHEYEEVMGHRLLRIGRSLEVGGVWGVNGFRARILVYRRYADISFFDLFRYERSQRSLSSMFLAGLPTFLTGHLLKMATHFWGPMRRRKQWLGPVVAYIRVHLQLYVFLQRVEIIPASKWFPPWTYFVPGMAMSPIAAPAPPEDLSAASLLRYAGAWCVNAVPFVSFVVWGQLWTRVTTFLWQEFYGRLPNTVHHRRFLPPPPPPPPVVTASVDPPQETGRQPIDIPPARRDEILRDLDDMMNEVDDSLRNVHDMIGQAATDEPSTALTRRPSGFSARGGDDFASDDDEDGGISATLISFDVEATDATDAPPGLWSAELRPSAGEGPGLPAPPATYVDTMLTRLPACLASDIFTVISSYVLVAPYEAMALRLVARSYRARMGLPCLDIYEPNIFAGMGWRGLANFFGVEFLHLSVAGEIWAMVTLFSQVFHLTEEEFREIDEGRDEAPAADESPD